mmetsp:Transcript_23457/g.51453  ORF Transcript_23457/g.51453 Transcript_23457/m.51453 type:complete len:446 (-) Transcript_23457:126-1463(-)|eukprot:CAMPEP_0206464112 /NCGR_PEP_ID=MMETSP0324_2-20121206/27019_1 /ASSEMBLY_ACC=CAM_ASM_000836 /TAXON_ID=2866 /ORGANISM="Crypthecodinium cohnii, Strain Seligo" /LENGTH=445 /DNA_ID=CAMNT_0053936675 /DNA_START=32 /DNA_END=1369 /DNA_ORIENTATION=-
MTSKVAVIFTVLVAVSDAIRTSHEGGSSTRGNATAHVSRIPNEEERDGFLKTHNMYRCLHGANPVVWDDAMAKAASEYVETLKGRKLVHSDCYHLDPPQGENLFWSSAAVPPASAVGSWYDEVNDCKGGPTEFTDGCADPAKGMTGHFTALVWNGAEAIGCAIKDDTNSRTVICRYRGPLQGGKFTDTPNTNKGRGEYPKRVFPRSKTKEECSASTGEVAPAPSPSGGSTKGKDPAAGRVPKGDEREGFVEAHNIYRCMHGSNLVVWDEEMAEAASAYVATLSDTMKSSNSYQLSPPQGENLYQAASVVTPNEVVTSWYDEVDGCQGGAVGFTDGCATPADGKVTLHFTAMIWDGAEAIGCAVKDKAPRMVICRYRGPKDGPATDTPNWNKETGEYTKHVFPRKKAMEECTAQAASKNGCGPIRGSTSLGALIVVALSSAICSFS